MATVITTQGTQVDLASTILANVKAIFINVFGISPDTTTGNPTNQFIQEITNMVVSLQNQVGLTTTTVYNPDSTQGIFTDGLCRLNGILRQPATQSIALCTVTGLANTVIPINSVVINPTTGEQYYNASPITIPPSGVLFNAEFTAFNYGAIPVPANSVTQIQQNLAGWSSVNNPAIGITGKDTQTDNSMINMRRYMLALQSTGWVDAMNSMLTNFMNQTGSSINPDTGYKYVMGYYVIENDTNTAVLLPHDVTNMIAPKSIYITVYAPQFLYSNGIQSVANTTYLAGLLLSTKSGGCETQNLQTGLQAFDINYTSAKWINSLPMNIKYDSPTPVPIQFNLTIQIFSNTVDSSSVIPNVQNAIVSQFYDGYNSISPILMVQSISANAFIGSIVSKVGYINVQSITIQTVTAGTPAGTLPAMSPMYIYTLATANIIVTIAS